jgi:hypothetical protein
MTQLFQIKLQTIKWPTLDRASHEKRSAIVAFGIPPLPVCCKHKAVILINLKGDLSIEKEIENWVRKTDGEHYFFNNKQYAIRSKFREIEDPLPPYLFIEAPKIPSEVSQRY